MSRILVLSSSYLPSTVHPSVYGMKVASLVVYTPSLFNIPTLACPPFSRRHQKGSLFRVFVPPPKLRMESASTTQHNTQHNPKTTITQPHTTHNTTQNTTQNTHHPTPQTSQHNPKQPSRNPTHHTTHKTTQNNHHILFYTTSLQKQSLHPLSHSTHPFLSISSLVQVYSSIFQYHNQFSQP